MENKKYICPICGYNKLDDPPYDITGVPSFEICPCCGYEFGSGEYFCNGNYPKVDVGYKFDYKENKDFYKYVRELWIKQGTKWFAKDEKPSNWNLETQLKNIEKIDS